MAPHRSPDILFENHVLLLAGKPPDMPTIPGRDGADSLLGLLRGRYGDEVRAVYRLDRETSGVICFTRSLDAQRALIAQFEQRTASKTYLALARGVFEEDAGEIDHPIANDVITPGKMTCSRKRGKEATTAWRVLIRFRDLALLEVTAPTQRTHQIRLHLAHVGHPLAADPLYGNGSPVKLSAYKGNYRLKRGRSERPLLDRTGLHLWRLEVMHPETEKAIRIQAPLPKDMRSVVYQLRGRALVQDFTDGAEF